MKGLILKDLINIKSSLKSMILFILMFAFIFSMGDGNNSGFMGFIIVLCTTMIISTFVYDDTNKWDGYALTMPITRNEIVLSKYLTMLIFGLTGAFFSLVISILIGIFKNNLILNEVLLVTVLLLSVSLCFGSLILPLVYKFGTEKARLFMILCFLVPTAILLGIKSILDNFNSALSVEVILNTIVYSLPFIAILLFVGSYFISSKIYSKKDM